MEKAVQKQAPDESRGVVFAVRTAEGEERVVEVPLSSVATDYAASIDRAWQVGNTLSFGARGGVYLKCLVQGETVLPVYQDSENLDTILDGVEQALGRDPVEPTWETNDTHLILTKGQPGNQVDRKAIQEAIDTAETPKDIEGYLKRCTLYVEEDLLNGPLVKKSTNPMSNMAHSLEMECKQELLKDLRYLNRLLQSETVSERIRPQEAPRQEIVPVKEKKKTGPRLR